MVELTRNDVLLRAQQVRNADLLDVRVLLLEVVGEREGHDGQAAVVVCAGLAVFALVRLALLVLGLALWAVDVADAAVPACGLEGFGQQARVGHGVLHDSAVAIETEVDEVVVLGDYLSAGAGEVEGEGFFGAACGIEEGWLARVVWESRLSITYQDSGAQRLDAWEGSSRHAR